MAVFESNGIRVEYNDNVDGVLEALQNAKDRGLMAIGEKAVDYASELVPYKTGRLKDSITYEVDGDDVVIGTNLDYAKYVEFGTGVYAEEGGRQTPWSYQDSEGEWHFTKGQAPQPFIRPAASEHGAEYGSILRESLENA